LLEIASLGSDLPKRRENRQPELFRFAATWQKSTG
jgi:hypothetical protein